MPQFDAEGLEGPDLLDIEKDVHAFARLLAARDLNPPLAIGLFGDWGTGKSFFMHKLRRRIEHLAELARAHREDTDQSEDAAFHDQIVHVEFNAWHYVESNLWASLVTHIFETLHRHFSKDETESEKWEQLLRKLDHAHLLELEASRDLEEAEEDLQEARKRADQERDHVETKIKEAWAALVELLPRGDHNALESGLGEAGFEDLGESLLTNRHRVAELDWGLPGLQTVIVRSLADWRSLAVAATAGILLPFLVLVLGGEIASQDWLQQGLGVLSQGIALVGGGLGWLGTALIRGKRTMEAIQRAHVRVRTGLAATEEGQALIQAEGRLVGAQEEVEERRQRLAHLRAELEQARPSRRLASFLAERAESQDYRKHLGLPALVRRDFEQLHRLMTSKLEITLQADGVEQELDENRVPAVLQEKIREIDRPPLPTTTVVREVPGAGTSWILDDAENGRKIRVESRAGELHCTVDWNLPTVQRIILYIDDLDRCPPERVVEVLQAVHLLLAFPLFVVVVGVDARWMSSALTLQYGRLWRRFPDGPSRPGPYDYLEKIFQVPFWMEPLRADSTQTLLNGLLRDSLEPVEVEGPTAGGGPGGGAGATSGSAPGRSGDGETDARDTNAVGAGARRAGKREDEEDLRPASLRLTRKESTFMKRLAPLFGRTPRTVKRFVNVYRLIRAGKRGAELRQFLAHGDPLREGFGPLLMALAIQVGLPNSAPQVFQLLRASNPEGPIWDEILEGLRSDDPEADKLRMLLAGSAEIDFPLPEHLVAWLPEVERYSFSTRQR